MKAATKKILKDTLTKLDVAYSLLEQVEDPQFEDDDSDITEVMDHIQEAKDKLNEMVGD